MDYTQQAAPAAAENYNEKTDTGVIAVYLDGGLEDSFSSEFELAPAAPPTPHTPVVAESLFAEGEFDHALATAYISTWAAEREKHLDEFIRASNRSRMALYQTIATGPFDYCVRAAAQHEFRQKLLDGALNAVLQQRGIKSKKGSGRSIRAVKVMFGGESRSLVSAYAKLIDAGMEAAISTANFPAWLESQGGAEAVRRSQSAKERSVRASTVSEHDQKLRGHVWASFKVEDRDRHLFDGKAGEEFALFVSYTEAGELVVHGVVSHDNAALPALRAACYRAHEDVLTLEPLPPAADPVTLAPKDA